jgi:hypothetical protein
VDNDIQAQDNKSAATTTPANGQTLRQIWQDTKTRPQAAPFEPFALAQWQIERLAKLTKLNYGKDNP